MRFVLNRECWLSLAVLAAACLCLPGSGRAAEAKPVTVTEKNKGDTVNLAKGQELVVRLPIRSGTGFTWIIIKQDDKQLKKMGDPKVERDKGGKIGGLAKQVFRFKALKAGTSTLELHYLRPF